MYVCLFDPLPLLHKHLCLVYILQAAPTSFGFGASPAFGQSAVSPIANTGYDCLFACLHTCIDPVGMCLLIMSYLQPAFGAQSAPAFGAQSSAAFGAQSAPAFGATPAFGGGAGAFGGGGAFGAKPAFGASSPAFGASATSTPAFGQTPGGFGAASQPFGQTGDGFPDCNSAHICGWYQAKSS